VVLENIDGSNQFMTIVERSRKNGLSVLVNGEDLVKGLRRPDRQKYLEEQILGFNESVFRAACYFSQKDLTMLTGMTDGDRTDMITALLGFEEYDDMYIKTVDKQKMLLKDIEQKRGEQACDDNTLSGVAGKLSVLLDIIHDQEAEAKKARLESDVAEKNVQAARVELQKAKAETKFFDTEDYTHAADDLSEKETTLRNLVVDVDNKIDTSDLPQEISLTQTDLRMAERAVKELGAQTEQYKQDVAFTQLPNAEAIAEARRAADKYRAQAESYQRTNNAVQAEIDRVRSLQQGQCANCGAPITGDSIKALLTGKEQALAIGVETMRGLDEQARAAQAQAKIMIETGRKELLESTLRRLNDKNVEKEKLASRLRDLSNTLAGLEREREAYQQKLQDIRNAKDELAKRRAENDRRAREAERKAADLQSKVKEYESRKDYYDSVIVKAKDYIEQTRKQTGLLEEEKAAIKTRIKEAERAVLRANESVERLEFWKTGFSSKGIRSVLLDRFCNEFNFLVNKHLTMTSAGAMSIVVSPTSETKGGELRNKIGLAIKIGGMVSVYEALSGGEQRRVDIALCLALNEWVSLKYNMPYGLLGVIVMDELFSDLDKTGEESVASVLAEESKKRAIIIISHTGEMASHADRVWLVSKKDHVSSLCVNEEV
jgi:DNA repair exonuclease SbcCD ATPase subunit